MLHTELYQKFFLFNKNQPLEPTMYVLYMTLLEKWIENNCESFELSTAEILKEVNMSRATINRTKPQLKELGLIDYSSENGGSTKYTISEINIEIEVPQIKTEVPQVPQMEIPVIVQPLENVEKQEVIIPEIPKEVKPSKKDLSNKKTADIPTFEEILTFAKTLSTYDDDMEIHLQTKYDSWVENGWKNGFDKPITNWKSTVRNSIPYLKRNQNSIPNLVLPTIQRPITTYNE